MGYSVSSSVSFCIIREMPCFRMVPAGRKPCVPIGTGFSPPSLRKLVGQETGNCVEIGLLPAAPAMAYNMIVAPPRAG